MTAVIWLLFAWNPQASAMQPVEWFPTERACHLQELIEARRHWPVQAPICGAVSRARWGPEVRAFR